jgi:L-ribulokinase
LHESGVAPDRIVGVGIDFTSCTILPTTADGLPLCTLPEWRSRPHSWVKLWKHHAAQRQADRLNALASESAPDLLAPYGGRISSEWLFPKVMQIIDEDPGVFDVCGRILEAGDWVVWQLTGREVRSRSGAGYKAMWSAHGGYPALEFLSRLDGKLPEAIGTRIRTPRGVPGERAGGLTRRAAQWLGLPAGLPVAIASLDGPASVLACGVTEPGRMAIVIGTSMCHFVLGSDPRFVEGMSGVVEDGIVPGLWGYEAGQPCVGDQFAWFVANAVPCSCSSEAEDRGITVHELLGERAGEVGAGQSGLLALDWWNGNRSVLADSDLTGVLLGLTLATRPEEIYRALMEGTAFGTRVIIEAFESSGVAVEELVACGGLPHRSPLLMQILADVTGRRIGVASTAQSSALGAAITAAVAAGSSGGGYSTIAEASRSMGHVREAAYVPDPAACGTYLELYREYHELHDWFGRRSDVMKRVRRLRDDTLSARRDAGWASVDDDLRSSSPPDAEV